MLASELASGKSHVECEPKQFHTWTQPPLFDADGRAARASRDDSFHRVSSRQSLRRSQILEALDNAGPNGLTRYELAQALGIQQSSVCNAALQLIFGGEIIETSCRRESRAGGSGLVLVHAKHGVKSHG